MIARWEVYYCIESWFLRAENAKIPFEGAKRHVMAHWNTAVLSPLIDTACGSRSVLISTWFCIEISVTAGKFPSQIKQNVCLLLWLPELRTNSNEETCLLNIWRALGVWCKLYYYVATHRISDTATMPLWMYVLYQRSLTCISANAKPLWDESKYSTHFWESGSVALFCVFFTVAKVIKVSEVIHPRLQEERNENSLLDTCMVIISKKAKYTFGVDVLWFCIENDTLVLNNSNVYH